MTFKAGPRLQFLFHSDSSNNEWGYKFSVTAYGLPDVAVSWGLDLQLLVSRLMGRLASRSMALKSLRGECLSQPAAGIHAESSYKDFMLGIPCENEVLFVFPTREHGRLAGLQVHGRRGHMEVILLSYITFMK